MKEMPMSKVRENLSEVVDATRRSGEPLYLTKHGKPVAVLVDYALFESVVERLEDYLDREALAESEGEVGVPWEQVKRELGLE
jgi:prevent-host-death family protein